MRRTNIRFFHRAAVGGFFLFLICPVLSNGGENHLVVDASIAPRRLSKGQEGKIILKISLREGMTVIPQPQFLIDLKDSKELIFPKYFFTASDLEIEIGKMNGREFLNLNKPVEIPFTVSLEALRGNHTLEGTIKYFVCNFQEGYGIKTTAKFSADFYTLNRIHIK
ncbi:MAG: hypothetical protein KKD56_02905 [Acidobacteria bacterium]|nr:hypothetical protein [Acidobacteriota bacterium]MBU1474887.1 hypothetical protein [Acidobacteriota bacterium]MBU2438922.1 hypothetical protein [Acidobacteriota bacterium]MBU4496076.1 hypothetical protein [Acidobacteriota bacterium]